MHLKLEHFRRARLKKFSKGLKRFLYFLWQPVLGKNQQNALTVIFTVLYHQDTLWK